jgi:4-hydroxybenzoate polyprenyltransferase
MTAPTPPSAIIADARADNWVDRHAPGWLKPYLKLGRFDRPIGSWLLLFPCWWSQTLAELKAGSAYPNLWFLALFLIGAFVMRGAGCTWNDIVDRDYDVRVARTALRPIPSGQLSVAQAVTFGILLCLVGLIVLLQFNRFTVVLGLSSMALVAIYPFAKRYTYWPQIVLGLTFKWGALVGWAAIQASLDVAALVLYVGCVLWTIGYDTIYAHQDKEDDELVGLKSTALRFGDRTPPWLVGFYGSAAALWAVAGLLAGAQSLFFVALLAITAHFAWQIRTLDVADSSNCLVRFRANRFVGWIMLAGIVGEMALRSGS